jgi:hypothetical protein
VDAFGILWLLVVELILYKKAFVFKACDNISLLRIEPSNLDAPGLSNISGPVVKLKRGTLSVFVCNV